MLFVRTIGHTMILLSPIQGRPGHIGELHPSIPMWQPALFCMVLYCILLLCIVLESAVVYGVVWPALVWSGRAWGCGGVV